eukprot:14379918-Alexandrium_andersonii.AAC.1
MGQSGASTSDTAACVCRPTQTCRPRVRAPAIFKAVFTEGSRRSECTLLRYGREPRACTAPRARAEGAQAVALRGRAE